MDSHHLLTSRLANFVPNSGYLKFMTINQNLWFTSISCNLVHSKHKVETSLRTSFLVRSASIADARHDTVAKIDALQAEYSAFETLHERDGLIDTAKELGIAYVAYSPLGHGWLVDDMPYKTPDDFPADDFRRSSPKFTGENFYNNKKIVDELKVLADRKGCSLAQIAIGWVIAQNMIPIVGTSRTARLEENVSSRTITFNEDEKKEMRRILDSIKPAGNRYGEAGQAMVGH